MCGSGGQRVIDAVRSPFVGTPSVGGGGGGSAPAPVPPKPPAQDAAFAASTAEAQRAGRRRGRRSTIITGPQGIEEPANTRRRTILGA